MSTSQQPRVFSKPALSVEDQVALLRQRGLLIADEASARHHLTQIGYYRLSGYMLAFQKGGQGQDRHQFQAGIDFAEILDVYDFDRELRLVIINGIERIEVAVRAAISDTMSKAHGPHWLTDQNLFEKPADHQSILTEITRTMNPKDSRKRDIFIQHYFSSYDHPTMPPCWMVFEAISFGSVSYLLSKLKVAHRNSISARFGVPEPVFLSWCHSLSYLRNLCAHHARVWNRTFTIKPMVSKAYADDLNPNTRIYAQLVTMRVLLKKISPTSSWHRDLAHLFADHPRVTPHRVGFKQDWPNRLVWR
jgi:abortive infection bacteriophage resistance protein